MTDARVVAPGLLALREPPAGMPDIDARPPVVAESRDPFSTLRVIALLARIERGRPTRVADIVAGLNAAHLDWLFGPAVVVDAALQLQANWMADYRNTSGIVIEDGPYGATIEIEDSTRVDPWFVRQAQREAAECRDRLARFSRRERPESDD